MNHLDIPLGSMYTLGEYLRCYTQSMPTSYHACDGLKARSEGLAGW